MLTSIKLKPIYSLLWAIIIILVIHALSDCRAHDLARTGQTPTQYVGEQPPSPLSSPTTIQPTPTYTSTPVLPTEQVTMLVGPTPYPLPGPEITPWEQLLDPSLIADVNWETYQGELQGNDKSERWGFSFLYPAGWYGDTKSSLIQAFVQSVPVTQSPAPAEFVKFEIVRLTAPPMIEDGHALYPKDLITVKMAGEPGIVYSVTQQADRVRQIMVIFQHNGGWLVATGYITISTPDTAALERFTAIIFNILASFSFHEGEVSQGSVPEIGPITPGAVVPIRLAQPFDQANFQAGAFDFQFYLYQDTGFSRNPSIAWMYSEIPGVGTHVSWVYHGPDLEGQIVETWGICPDVLPRSVYSNLRSGGSSIREGGISLPQNVSTVSVVQFVFKIETPDGIYGGILTFSLQQGPQGVGPSEVSIYPIDQAGPTNPCISTNQSSSMP